MIKKKRNTYRLLKCDYVLLILKKWKTDISSSFDASCLKCNYYNNCDIILVSKECNLEKFCIYNDAIGPNETVLRLYNLSRE